MNTLKPRQEIPVQNCSITGSCREAAQGLSHPFTPTQGKLQGPCAGKNRVPPSSPSPAPLRGPKALPVPGGNSAR